LLADLAVPLDPAEADVLPAAVKDRQERGAVTSLAEMPAGTEKLDPSLAAQAVMTTWEGMKSTAGDVARGIAGGELYRDPSGYLYERDRDGNVKNVGRESRYQAPDGTELELVDRGGGRYEWQRVEQSGKMPRGWVRGVIQRPTN
jgi:hypothetical protein